MKKNRPDYTDLADHIEELIGGKENVSYLSHCMTRLRFVVNDKTKVNEEKIRKIKGVKGTAWAGDQFQIIIGQTVDKALAQIQEKTGIGLDTSQQKSEKKKITLMSLFETIAAIMTPIISLLIGAGVIRVFMILLTFSGIITTKSPTYITLNFVADAAYYFLPILVGASTAKRFGLNTYIGMFLGAILLHPTFIDMVSKGDAGSIFGIPIYATSYSTTIFPVILNVLVATQVEKFFKKHSPELLRAILVPFGTILVMAPLSLCLLSPVGAFIGNYISSGAIWIYNTIGFIGVGIVAGLYPILVSIGMHNAFGPYLFQQLSAGSESLLSPAVVVNNISIGAACLGIGLKSKNTDTKTEAASCAVTAIAGGVTEPGLYGFVLGNKRVLLPVMLGNFIGGCIAGLIHSTAYAFAGSYGVLGLTVFIGGKSMSNVLFTVLAVVVGAVISFICTMLFYKEAIEHTEDDEPVLFDSTKQSSETNGSPNKETVIYSPIKGDIQPLDKCKDDVFAQKALGDGILISPAEGKVYAPFDGEIMMIFDTLHAIALKTNDGLEMIIHVGLNTVELNGEGFTPHIKNGDVIKKGQLLLEFDIDAFKEKGIDVSTPVIVTNMEQVKEMTPVYGPTETGSPVLHIEKQVM